MALLKKIFGKDPEKELDKTIIEFEKQLKQAHILLMEAIGIKNTIHKKYNDCQKELKKYIDIVEEAKKRSDIETAKNALEKQIKAEEELSEIKTELDNQEHEIQKLQDDYKILELQIKEVKDKKEALLMSKAKAEAKIKIHETLYNLNSNNTNIKDNLSDIEERSNYITAKANSIHNINKIKNSLGSKRGDKR